MKAKKKEKKIGGKKERKKARKKKKEGKKGRRKEIIAQLIRNALDASLHIYKKVCHFVRPYPFFFLFHTGI